MKSIAKSKKENQSIVQCLKKQDKRNISGSTLPEEMRVFRFELRESFLRAGIPLSKIDDLRPFLEKHGHRLTASGHLSELIPSILEKEKEKVKSELQSVEEVSIIFDGTTRLGEALAVVIRFVQENFKPTQRLLRLQVVAKALKAEELAQRLMSYVAVDHHFGPSMLLAAIRDGASVNGAALRQLSFFYPNMMDIVCFSHTIDNVGNHFQFNVLDSFTRYWVSLFSRSHTARLLWKERTGISMNSQSETRWWSKWEILRQVADFFGDVEPFLRENETICPANRQHLLNIIDNPQDLQDLRLELAAIVDAGVYFVKATYYLEGDGPLIFSCYEKLSAVSQAVAVGHYPITTAVAREIASGDAALQNQLVAQAKACIQPGLNFFQQKFSVQFHTVVRAFKVARLCCTIQVQVLKPTADSLEEFRNYPFLNDDSCIASLAQELPAYLAAAEGVTVSNESEKVDWWAAHRETLPNWAAVVKKLLLIQPSSASAERVFSLLNTFSSQQEHALEDCLESSVMLRYNNSQRK